MCIWWQRFDPVASARLHTIWAICVLRHVAMLPRHFCCTFSIFATCTNTPSSFWFFLSYALSLSFSQSNRRISIIGLYLSPSFPFNSDIHSLSITFDLFLLPYAYLSKDSLRTHLLLWYWCLTRAIILMVETHSHRFSETIWQSNNKKNSRRKKEHDGEREKEALMKTTKKKCTFQQIKKDRSNVENKCAHFT